MESERLVHSCPECDSLFSYSSTMDKSAVDFHIPQLERPIPQFERPVPQLIQAIHSGFSYSTVETPNSTVDLRDPVRVVSVLMQIDSNM